MKVVFNYRHPGPTVRSLMKEKELEGYVTREEIVRGAEDEWLTRNRSVLEFLDGENRSPVCVVRYDDLVDRKLDETLCRFVGWPLDLSFIEPARRRSTPMPVRQELLDLYEELNDRFQANRNEIARTTRLVPVKVTTRTTLRTWRHIQANRIVNGVRWRLARLDRLQNRRWAELSGIESQPIAAQARYGDAAWERNWKLAGDEPRCPTGCRSVLVYRPCGRSTASSRPSLSPEI